MLLGLSGHGKDAVCDNLPKSVKHSSSSKFALRTFMFLKLQEKYGYVSRRQCYEDRVNKRQDWYEGIKEHCSEDPAKLGRDLFKYNTVYNGCRNRREFEAMRKEGLFDVVVWVDSSKRLGSSDDPYMELTSDDADYILDNNGTLIQLKVNMVQLLKRYLSKVK